MTPTDADYVTPADAAPDLLRQFLAALPDRLRHKLQLHPLSPQGVADVHTALALGLTPLELAGRVAAGDAAGAWNAPHLVHFRLHKAAGHGNDYITDNTDGGLDD